MNILTLTVLCLALTSEDEARNTNVGKLRNNIHDLRMRLLLGGDRVRSSEAEAMEFYRQKTVSIDRRLDDVATDLAEKRAEYDVALERVLDTPGGDRRAAARRASLLRQQRQDLEDEATNLEQGRLQYEQAVELVRKRGRERERLVNQLEAPPSTGGFLAAPLPGLGLAPEPLPESGPMLTSPELVEDLLARDPERARQILIELDPAEYWRRWPLQPPVHVLRSTLRFPLPDLPKSR